MAELAPGFIGLQHLFARRIDEVGWQEISDAVVQSTALFNRAFDDIIGALVTDVTAPQVRYVQPASGTMQPLDEYGRPLPASGQFSYDVGFPLQMGGYAWGASWVAREKMTVAEVNAHTLAVQRAYADWNIRRILGALFYSNSYVFADEQFGSITVESLARGEAGVRYPSNNTLPLTSHNHFVAQTAAIADATNPFPVIKTKLAEHPGQSGKIVAYINSAQRAAVEGLAGFVGIADPDVTAGSGTDTLNEGSAPNHLGDELIGKTDGVWVAEWYRIPANYILAHVSGVPVLGRRQDVETSLRGLISKEITGGIFPTYEFYTRAGYGVLNRVGAVAYQVSGADTVYDNPTGYTVMPLAI